MNAKTRNQTTDKTISHFQVEDIPSCKYHKIGYTANQHIILFVAMINNQIKIFDRVFEIIDINFCCHCKLSIDDTVIDDGYYTLITLKSNDLELQKYFKNIVLPTIMKLPEKPSADILETSLKYVIQLFRFYSTPAIKTLQGLWGELLIIEQSNDCDHLVHAWHSVPSDSVDFNDQVSKLEVKTTLKDSRVHTFSQNQLSLNLQSKLFIASIQTERTDCGVNIFDLRNNISARLKDKTLLLKLDRVIFETLGNDIEKAGDIRFDYVMGSDSIKIFDIKNMPLIPLAAIPRAIANIHFECDMSELPLVQECPIYKMAGDN